jgi:dipeptidyl aminopeptidase/acylaminoacyl peptidase
MKSKVTFTPRRFLRRIWQLGNYDVSPDGRLQAYSANKGEQWSVYVMDLRTRREKILVKSTQSVMNPEFSPDGQWIAVQSDFDGDENFNLYIVPARGDEPRKLTDTPTDSSFPRWSPDGEKIAFISNRDGDRDNVFVMDSSGGATRQLTHVEDIVSEIAWRPDGQSIAFSAGVGHLDYVGLVDLQGRMEQIVAFPDSENSIAGGYGRPEPWSPDGSELAFVSNLHDHLDIGILDMATRQVTWLVQNRWDKDLPLWSPDGRRIAYMENHNGNVQLRTVARSGRGVRVVSPTEGTASRPMWHPNGDGMFYIHSTFLQPHRLYLQKGKRRSCLVEGARAKPQRGELAMGKLVRYLTFDGRTIPAWLFTPSKGRSRNAAVVVPHGGPEAQVLNDWSEATDFQFLVARGYTVLAPNYRGGTGYGRAWRKISDKDLGGGDMQDIIAGGRWLVEKGYCPLDRLGIVGASYGGYSVAHCLEQAPDLWAVGVSIVGYFNWFAATKNERGYLHVYDLSKMGTPEENAELYRRFSPIFYLDKIRAPVLFTGGAHDPRCPVTEARQMVEEMKKMGKTIDYLEFPDEGHWPRKISNLTRLYERTIDWLDRFLPAT